VQDNHTGFGGAILRRWGFSEDYIRVALLHEGPVFSEKSDSDVLLVKFANQLSRNLRFCASQQEPVDLTSLDSFRYLDIKPEVIDSAMENVSNLMEGTSTIL
jgi:HD-like signal output (HDOD) protein